MRGSKRSRAPVSSPSELAIGNTMPGPLNGVRVIDLTTVAMGPLATQMLGDMGADVIKVEGPAGDQFRAAPPQRNPGMGAGFLNLNRNKRSIALDLKMEADRSTLRELIATADVFVSNIRPQALRKLGLDYESLRDANPRLIYCATCGFSERGPYAGRPAYDDIIQAMSGMAVLQGRNRDGVPAYVNTIVADKTTGITAAAAISMALFERERSGQGQAIEVPMFETMVAYNLHEHLAGETFVPAQDIMGYNRVLSKYRRPYRTRDGYIALLPYTTEHWRRFFEFAGAPEHAGNPRFMDPDQRLNNVDEAYGVLADLLERHTTAEWLEILADADIPMAPVFSPEDLLGDPHLEATGFITRERHPTEGEIRNVGMPVRFSRTPGTLRRLAPRLGEHGDEIRKELKPSAGTS